MSDGFPIGAIIAFPGNADPTADPPPYPPPDPPSSNYWALCDGTPQSTTGPYAPLFAIIGFANGGSSASGQFNLPDYRGRFLRGTTYDTKNDPDAYSRTAMNDGGNTGNAVGSVQGYETISPTNRFLIDVPHLPTSNENNAATAVGPEAANWNSGSVHLTFQGGDQETRPKNVYVFYYIKYTDAAPN
jgi:microcystin-dependent protein